MWHGFTIRYGRPADRQRDGMQFRATFDLPQHSYPRCGIPAYFGTCLGIRGFIEMQFRVIISLSVLGGIFSVQAQSDQVKEWLATDQNGDGVLTLDETSGLMTKFFSRVDEDGDGKLSSVELGALERRLASKAKGKSGGRKGSPAAIPEGVEVRKNQVYREGHNRWKLDVYLPEEEAPEGGRPGIVFVHGGGWKSGSKDDGVWASFPAHYAAKGYVCISVNYRLTADGGGFPACVHDVKNAVRWFRANADDLGLDPDRIGAYGNSAGAHLVSILGLVKKEAGLEGEGSHLDQSSLVQAVCASATPADFLSWKGEPFSNRGLLAGDEATLAERAAAASPVTYAAGDAPPFLLVHAEDDSVVPIRQGAILEEKLKDAGAKGITWMTFEDGGHGVFRAKESETYPAMEAFFAKALKKGK